MKSYIIYILYLMLFRCLFLAIRYIQDRNDFFIKAWDTISAFFLLLPYFIFFYFFGGPLAAHTFTLYYIIECYNIWVGHYVLDKFLFVCLLTLIIIIVFFP